MDSMKTPVIVYCVLISNFEAFRLLNSEVFEALLLKKKLLIKKTGCILLFTNVNKRANSGQLKLKLTNTKQRRPTPTNTDQSRPMPTNADQRRQVGASCHLLVADLACCLRYNALEAWLCAL